MPQRESLLNHKPAAYYRGLGRAHQGAYVHQGPVADDDACVVEERRPARWVCKIGHMPATSWPA